MTMNKKQNNLLTLTKEYDGEELQFRFNKETETSEVRIDEIAKFCGWTTIAKSGNECIRWNRVKEKLNLLGIANIGNGDFIPENIMYPLIGMADFKKNPKARDFMMWVGQVLTELRKYGVVQIRETEDIDRNYLKYNYKALKETILKAPIENLNEEYLKCLKWYKETKYRVPYGNNSNRRSDATHTINDSKIMMMRKVIATLESRSLKLLENNKFGSVYEIDNAIKQIKDDISKQQNLSNRGKLGQATNKINKLKEQVEFHNPKIEDFIMIPVHGFTVNFMYKDNKRTDAYNRWINKFPNYILKNNFGNIDLNKPTKLWLKFDCLQKFDVDGMIKSIQDQIVRALGFTDDNNIELGSIERNKIVNSYNEGKIYILMKNV